TATKKGSLTATVDGGPVVTGITPATPPKAGQPIQYTFSGSGLNGVTSVEAVPTSFNGNKVPAQNVQKSANQLTCTLTLSSGTWKLQISPGTVSATAGQVTVNA